MMLPVQGAIFRQGKRSRLAGSLCPRTDSADLWDQGILRLQNSYWCILFDLPGFGRSTVPKGFDCSLPAMAQFMEDLIQAFGITKPVNLVVHDFGGPYGLAWVVKHPTRVKRLVYMNTIFFEDYHWHFWARIWRKPLLGELSMLLMNRWIFRWEMRRGSPHIPDDHIRRTYAHVTPSMKKWSYLCTGQLTQRTSKGGKLTC